MTLQFRNNRNTCSRAYYRALRMHWWCMRTIRVVGTKEKPTESQTKLQEHSFDMLRFCEQRESTPRSTKEPPQQLDSLFKRLYHNLVLENNRIICLMMQHFILRRIGVAET